MKLIPKLLTVAAAALLALPSLAQPKREMRSAWMAGMGIDWPKSKTESGAKAEFIRYLDKFKEQNFTSVCVHVRPRADAYYKSSYEPWSADLTGTRGKDPGWDPLAFAVEECHKRGIEIYAWINPYRVNANNATYTTAQDKDWAARGLLFKSGNWTVFNPGLPEARQHCLNVFREIYNNYAIDGMLFDDYFYPGDGMAAGSAAPDYQLYKDSGSTLSIADWRRKNVNDFVREIYDTIQRERPDMRFGIGPAGVAYLGGSKYGISKPAGVGASDWQYDKIFADPLAWLADGSIDFIAPQIYWSRTHSTAPFEPLTKYWSNVAGRFGRHNYISVASYQVGTFGGNDVNGWSEIAAQIDITRNTTPNNAPGQVYYNVQSINGPALTGLGDYIGANRYQRPALTPLVDWKGKVSYPAVSNAVTDGTQLTWSAVSAAPKAIVRYTVYAVPTTVELKGATSADGDGIDAKYLLGVTYTPSYTLPQDRRSGYWYAVCVFDGYGYEHEPATVNYTAERCDAAQLDTPADGARTDWDVTMTWKPVADAAYRLQVARDKAFTDCIADLSGLTATSATVNVDEAADNAVLYWRVVTTTAGKLAGYSDIRSFTVPERRQTTAPVLLRPANGAELSDNTLQLAWQAEETRGVTQYVVEITRQGAGFDVPCFIKSVAATETSVDVASSLLGEATFNWRVTATGPRIAPTPSATGTFTLSGLSQGATEPGYVVKTDPAEYAPVGNLKIESLWYRAAAAPFENMTFSGNGSTDRGMVATPTHVFVSHRAENSQASAIFLRQYSAATGEHVRDIQLGAEAIIPYYPCNDVLLDTKGNVLIANLTLKAETQPMYLHLVDTANGDVTEVAKLSGASGRIDHAGVYGDAASGNFTVYAVLSGTAKVARWSFVNGTCAAPEIKTLGGLYPSATTFGTAPRVWPVSDSRFYVDGANTAPALYDWSNPAAPVTSFSAAAAAAPAHTKDNGWATFTLGNNTYCVYANNAADFGADCSIARIASADSFSGAQRLWTVPADRLGSVLSTTTSAPVAAVTTGAATANVYIYNPGNGLAAYRITDTTLGVDATPIADTVKDAFYNLQGQPTNGRTPGVHIRVTPTGTTKHLRK